VIQELVPSIQGIQILLVCEKSICVEGPFQLSTGLGFEFINTRNNPNFFKNMRALGLTDLNLFCRMTMRYSLWL
jgi:hypothetical protein